MENLSYSQRKGKIKKYLQSIKINHIGLFPLSFQPTVTPGVHFNHSLLSKDIQSRPHHKSLLAFETLAKPQTNQSHVPKPWSVPNFLAQAPQRWCDSVLAERFVTFLSPTVFSNIIAWHICPINTAPTFSNLSLHQNLTKEERDRAERKWHQRYRVVAAK